jgi:hypothetical protein
MLYGLGALAAPILIHLWQRRRVVQVHFSTLRFLKLAAAKTSRSSRIEHVLLLVLRCLVLVLLALASARPVIPTKTARLFGADVARTIVLAIDNSMSMNDRADGLPRLETAKKMALTVIDSLKPGDSVAVMSVGGRAIPLIAEPTVDHQVARQMIQNIRPGEERSDFPSAFIEARKIVAHESRGLREFYFFTDSQDNAWRFDPEKVFDEAWKKSELRTVIVRPDDANAPNATVREVRIQSPFLTAGVLAGGVAVIENFSTRPLQDLLEIEICEERVAQKPVEIPAGSSIEVPFEFQAPPVPGRWAEGVASIEGDNLPDDDRFYFALPVYQAPRVLVVEGQQAGAERLHSGFFLIKALTAGEMNAPPPKSVSIAQLDDTELETFSAVFLADIPGLSDRALVRIDRYLQGGGTVVLFPGDLANLTSFSRLDFLPAKAKEIRELPAGRLATRISEPMHPLFAGAWDAGTPFPALPQHKIIDWEPAPGAKTLIHFSNNTPFLIFGNRGPGRVIIVNASADRAWGDFPLSPAFLPLIQQIARLSSEQTGLQSGFTTGDALPFVPGFPTDQALTVKYPDRSTHQLPAGYRAQLVDRAEQSGFYEVSSATEGALRIVAVNTDRHESNLHPNDPAALEKLASADVITGLENLKLWLAQSRGTVPLWPLFLLLALAAFAAEAVLANIMAHNRSQGDAEHIKTGRLNKRRMGVSFRPAETEASR